MKASAILFALFLLLVVSYKQLHGIQHLKEKKPIRSENNAKQIQIIKADTSYRITISINSDSSGNSYWLRDEYCNNKRRFHLTKYSSYGTLVWQKTVSESGYTMLPSGFKIDGSGNACLYSKFTDNVNNYSHTYQFNSAGILIDSENTSGVCSNTTKTIKPGKNNRLLVFN